MPYLYESDPDDCPELKALDKLRKLLAEHPLTVDQYQGDLRQFPLTTVLKSDPSSGTDLPPAVALYSPIEGFLGAATSGGSGVGRKETHYQCALEIALHCGEDAGPDDLDAIYRRLKNYTYRFKRALMKYREDPTPSAQTEGQLWCLMTFLKPATVLKKTGSLMYTATRFTLTAHERMP